VVLFDRLLNGFLSLIWTVFEIFDFKNAVTLKIGLGYWSFEVIGNVTIYRI